MGFVLIATTRAVNNGYNTRGDQWVAKSILTRRLSFTKPRSAITFSFDSLIPPPLFSPLSAVLPFVIPPLERSSFRSLSKVHPLFRDRGLPRWSTHDEISSLRRDAWLVVRVSRDCVLKLLDVLDAAMSIANLLTRVWLTTLLISRACTVLSYNDIGIGISRPSRKLFVLVDCAMIFLRHRIVVFAIHLFLMDIFLWQMIGM